MRIIGEDNGTGVFVFRKDSSDGGGGDSGGCGCLLLILIVISLWPLILFIDFCSSWSTHPVPQKFVYAFYWYLNVFVRGLFNIPWHVVNTSYPNLNFVIGVLGTIAILALIWILVKYILDKSIVIWVMLGVLLFGPIVSLGIYFGCAKGYEWIFSENSHNKSEITQIASDNKIHEKKPVKVKKQIIKETINESNSKIDQNRPTGNWVAIVNPNENSGSSMLQIEPNGTYKIISEIEENNISGKWQDLKDGTFQFADDISFLSGIGKVVNKDGVRELVIANESGKISKFTVQK